MAMMATNANGEFNFEQLTPGSYVVEEVDWPQNVSITPNMVPLVLIARVEYPVFFGDVIEGRQRLPQIGRNLH